MRSQFETRGDVSNSRTNPREPSLFEFQISPNGRTLEIKVNSRKFDVSLAKEFRAALDTVWIQGLTNVTVDFTPVEFIDSAGVGALISVHKRFPAAPSGRPIDPSHQPVSIFNASPAVMTIIELLQLHRVFRLVRR
jgi:anti-anti-sigma regulatory factor